MRCIIIDNYDSFTYNLVHLLRELGADVVVKHNDDISLEEIDNYDRIVLSPGPGIPSEAGLMPDIIKHYAETNLYWEYVWDIRLLLKYLVVK